MSIVLLDGLECGSEEFCGAVLVSLEKGCSSEEEIIEKVVVAVTVFDINNSASRLGIRFREFCSEQVKRYELPAGDIERMSFFANSCPSKGLVHLVC